VVDGGQTGVAITYAITSTSTDSINEAIITVPAGFTITGTSAASSGAKNWTVTVGGSIITLVANGVTSYITNSQVLTVVAYVTTAAGPIGATPWPCSVYGSAGGNASATENVAGDMQVQIVTLSGTALATPHVVGAGQSGVAITYTVTST
jgi:hypothetical protein